MPILLALMAQTATLDADDSKAALACAMAVAVASPSENPMRITSQVSHFVMQAAKADPGGKPFLERMGELTGAADQTADSAKALLPECDRRFPLARASATVRLPADTFQRDLMCFGILGIFRGAAGQLEEDSGDAGALDRIQTVLAPISDRLTDAALNAHGITSEDAFSAAIGEQIKASLALGNGEDVARACGVASL
ncbi:hypothetical protein [Sphingomonas sp. dw_22]|uniref:hypothetical protein n=1 Tax=Sphingomonas sp. dw_22 TaxID=2721175 RepID=UPI001BD520C6|nr:hypothetical protein [Sphingomonas sp. dw_22]